MKGMINVKNSSMGHHTFAMNKKLSYNEANELLTDFKKHEGLKIDHIYVDKNTSGADPFIKWLLSTIPRYYVIHYPGQNKGITWLLRISKTSPGFIKLPPGYLDRPYQLSDNIDRPSSIRAVINTKVLTGINGRKDYLTAANDSDLKSVEQLFNIEAEKISPLLGNFMAYSMNRGDYCANIFLDGLTEICPSELIPRIPELIMGLIKHSDVPFHYTDKYEADKNSYYLNSKSATLNCYLKQPQLQKKQYDCPNIEAATYLLRFEVQYKYLKIYSLIRSLRKESDYSNVDLICKLLSNDFCAEVIKSYFDRVIKPGDYYTFAKAKKLIEARNFLWNKELRLINTLKLIDQCEGISKAKDILQGKELDDLRRSLRELAQIGINPVLIPDTWGIDHIQNLLDMYYMNLQNESPFTSEMCHELINYEAAKEADIMSDKKIAEARALLRKR